MKVAISTLVTPVDKSGIGNYVTNLLDALRRIDNENEYHVFIGRDTKHLFKLGAPNFHPVILPISHDPRLLMRPMYYLWQNSLAFFYFKQYGIDVLHLPNLLPLLIRFVPTVITIPDLTEYKVSKYSTVRQSYRKAILPLVARKASRVITISHNTKNELVTLTGISEEKIDVTYLASSIPSSNLATSAGMASVLERYGVKSKYVLYVGKMLPHKNLRRLIEAFAILRRGYQIPHRLVLVGKKDRNTFCLMELAKELAVGDQIVLTGYVPDSDLPAIYKGASLFVFPSISEGFSIPVLEAMTCGIPVVTSNVSSLLEVAGDAAVLVDPFSAQAIADGIWLVLRDEKTRRDMTYKGQEQAKRFTWEKCAQQTLSSYHKALEQPRKLI